jgi:integrase
MATIRKRGNSYHVQIRLKGLEPATASFDRLSDAKEWAAKTETELRAGKYFGQSKRLSFQDLVQEYLLYSKDPKRLEYWNNEFSDLKLNEVTTERINRVIKKLLSEKTQRFSAPPTGDSEQDAMREKSTRSGATVNRYIAALSSCLSYAVKQDWIERNPCFKTNKQAENEGRLRFLTEDDELPRLLDECRKHDILYLAVILSLTTGARQEEIMSLRWTQIDFKRRVIQLEKTKNGSRRALPLVGESCSLLTQRFEARDEKEARVFPPSSRAKKGDYLDLRRPWEDALRRANIPDFHWHDLRHTAASYLVMNGVSLAEVAKILGHKTLAMVLRYVHLADKHIVGTGEGLAKRMGI